LLGSNALRLNPEAKIGTICDFLGTAPPDAPILPKISRPAADIDYPATLSDRDVTFCDASSRVNGAFSSLGR